MTLAIEPMVNIGKAAVKVLSDGWTAVTVDGACRAHFEHTVAVTAERSVGDDGAAGTPPGPGKDGLARERRCLSA